MAIRRTGRRRTIKRQTYWTEGQPLSFQNTNEGEIVRDTAGTIIGRSHVVELVGAVDLPDVGGEGAVVKRVVGHCKPAFVNSAQQIPLNQGIAYTQFFCLITRPEGTQLAANDPGLLAPWLMHPITAGLGNEDILHTRFGSQNAYSVTSALSAHYNNVVILDGANIVHPRTDFWLPERDYDYDFTVSRKLHEDCTLFMVTDWQARGVPGDPLATNVTYEGFFRCLVMKGL